MNQFYKKQFIEFICMHLKGFKREYKTLFTQLNIHYDQKQIFKKCQEELLLFFEHIILNIKVIDFKNNNIINEAYKENLLNFISYTSGYYIKNYRILFDSIAKTSDQEQLFNELENTLITLIFLIYSNIKYTNNII